MSSIRFHAEGRYVSWRIGWRGSGWWCTDCQRAVGSRKVHERIAHGPRF